MQSIVGSLQSSFPFISRRIIAIEDCAPKGSGLHLDSVDYDDALAVVAADLC